MLLYIHAECINEIESEVTTMPRNKHPEETVQKILDVSLKLFSEKGYEQVTVLDIVNNLGGLTRGAFYHHFKSKEEVFAALSERLFQDNNPFGAVKGRDDLNGLEKLRMVFLYMTKVVGTEEGADYVAFQQIGLSLLEQPRFLAEHIKSNNEMAQRFAPLIEEGMKDGSIRPRNAKLLAELILLLFNLWMFPKLFPMDAGEFEEKAEMIAEMLDALGCPLMNEEFDEAGEAYAEILGIEE